MLLPVMGPRYLESARREEEEVTELQTVESVLREMDATTPIIYLLNFQSRSWSGPGSRSRSCSEPGSESGSWSRFRSGPKSGAGSGSDPSNSILMVAKKMRKKLQCIEMDMGECQVRFDRTSESSQLSIYTFVSLN